MTTREDIARRVTEVIGSHFDEYEGEPGEHVCPYDDLGADSLDGVEIVMELEDEFEIPIEDGFLKTNTTIGQVIDQLFEIINR